MKLHDLRYFKRPENIILFAQIFVSLIILKILLSLMKLPRLLRLLEPKKRIPLDDSKIEYIVKFTNYILHNVFRSPNPCLLKSLLFFRQLRMMGMDIKIAFGVKDDINGLQGHAWLIFNKNHFLGQDDLSKEYCTTFVYP